MDCHVPGCTTRSVKKLADHLRNVHKDLSPEQRQYYLDLGHLNASRVRVWNLVVNSIISLSIE